VYAVEVSHEYAASPSDLFAAFEAGSLFIARGAMPSSLVIDLREGGGFSFDRASQGRVTGVFTRVVPNETIEFVWAGMTAVLRFEPIDEGARLVLTHSEIPTAELRDAYADGWRVGLDHLVLPPLFPEEKSATGDESKVLSSFLAFQRAVVVGKLRGLSEEDARRRIVPSDTTPIGLVRHLTFVEREWFGGYLGERAPHGTPAEHGDGWNVPPEATVASVIADYQAACAESDAIASGVPLAHHVAHPRLGRVSLRWIYVHMIDESARHAGHLDILRELIDGTTGVDPP
jgi:uncharacterized protein YndB with AHSA1/START domain